MRPGGRLLQVVALIGLLAGCAPQPSISATATPSSPSSPSLPSPTSAAPTIASPSASPSAPTPTPLVPSASPSGTPEVTPSPSPGHPADFVTPIPPAATSAWTGIRWRKLSSSNPLAHVRTVTRWAGGLVAVGDLEASGGSAHSKVWVSADGATWDLLGSDVFGPTALVVGMAAAGDGIVALTLESGTYNENGDRSELGSWSMTGPWQSWTSSDGRTWTAHPGPDFTMPRDMSGDFHPTLLAGAGNHVLALVLGGHPLAFSTDGIAWQAVSLDAFPGGPAGWQPADIAALGPGFVALGSTTSKSLAISSADGSAWTSTPLPAGCASGSLTVARAGVIASFQVGDPHTARTVWCSSLDGRTWRALPKLPPIGLWNTADAQECRNACPNGFLLGDGERMFAFRGFPRQVGWTSFDGRSWRSLTFTGSRPTGFTDPAGYQYASILTPMGILFIGGSSVWFGTPT